jgi:hypothetical protein
VEWPISFALFAQSNTARPRYGWEAPHRLDNLLSVAGELHWAPSSSRLPRAPQSVLKHTRFGASSCGLSQLHHGFRLCCCRTLQPRGRHGLLFAPALLLHAALLCNAWTHVRARQHVRARVRRQQPSATGVSVPSSHSQLSPMLHPQAAESPHLPHPALIQFGAWTGFKRPDCYPHTATTYGIALHVLQSPNADRLGKPIVHLGLSQNCCGQLPDCGPVKPTSAAAQHGLPAQQRRSRQPPPAVTCVLQQQLREVAAHVTR